MVRRQIENWNLTPIFWQWILATVFAKKRGLVKPPISTNLNIANHIFEIS